MGVRESPVQGWEVTMYPAQRVVPRRCHSGQGDTCDALASGRNRHPQAVAGAQLPGSLSWQFRLPSLACAEAPAGSSSSLWRASRRDGRDGAGPVRETADPLPTQPHSR